MRNRLPVLTASLWLASLSAGAQSGAGAAADGSAASEPSPPQYQVEIVAFAYNAFDPNEEDFRHERRQPVGAGVTTRAPPALRQAQPPEILGLGEPPSWMTEGLEQEPGEVLAPVEPETTPASGQPPEPSPGQQPQAAVETTGTEPFHFRLLAPEELQLNDVYATLERLSAYTPLVHGGWVQQGLPAEETQPVDLSVLGALNPSGTIELYLSRFLHISVDLSYLGDQAAPADAAAVGLSELSLAPRYELRDERRARSGELHYFDHPAFGLLVVVRPQPSETPETGEASSPAA
jgi:hypothetical protein